MESEVQEIINNALEDKLKEAQNTGIILGAKTLATVVYGKLEHISIKSTKVEMAQAIADVKRYIDKARFNEEKEKEQEKKKSKKDVQ